MASNRSITNRRSRCRTWPDREKQRDCACNTQTKQRQRTNAPHDQPHTKHHRSRSRSSVFFLPNPLLVAIHPAILLALSIRRNLLAIAIEVPPVAFQEFKARAQAAQMQAKASMMSPSCGAVIQNFFTCILTHYARMPLCIASAFGRCERSEIDRVCARSKPVGSLVFVVV